MTSFRSRTIELGPLAFKPDELLAALIADLESRPLNATEQQALDDFNSGAFLPGRGILDMKSGIAAGKAVLEAFAEEPDRSGNLLLIATPDEERGSRGMRSLRDALAVSLAHSASISRRASTWPCSSNSGGPLPPRRNRIDPPVTSAASSLKLEYFAPPWLAAVSGHLSNMAAASASFPPSVLRAQGVLGREESGV
jgi:hypothetical protein